MSADSVYFYANWILAMAAGAGALATVAVVVSGNIRDANLKRELAARDVELAQAKEQLARTDEKILAERRLTANERWRLDRVEKIVLPRQLSRQQYDALLEKLTASKVKGPINVAFVNRTEPTMFAVQFIELLRAAHLLGHTFSLPRDSILTGVTTYRVDASGEEFAQILWQTAQVGGGSVGVRAIGMESLPEHENCLVVAENNAALQPGAGQPGEGIDQWGDPEACRSFSTSSGVRYSRLRLAALVWRAGGRGEPGLPAERRSAGFLLRRREATFPFTSIGAVFPAAGFPEAFAMPGSLTLPFRVENGNVQRDRPTSAICQSRRSRPG